MGLLPGTRCASLQQVQDAPEGAEVIGVDLNRYESSRQPLPFASPHSATPACSKGRLVRCTVPGLTPKPFGNHVDTGFPGVARASRVRFSNASRGASQQAATKPGVHNWVPALAAKPLTSVGLPIGN